MAGYLFTRVRECSTDDIRGMLEFVTEQTAFVNENTNIELSAYISTLGLPIGTITWAARSDTPTAVGEATAELIGSQEYLDRLERSTGLFKAYGPTEDLVREFHGTEKAFTEAPDVISGVSAHAIPGRRREAIGWATKSAARFGKLTGSPGSVLTTLFGPAAALDVWHSHENLGSMNEALAKLDDDPELRDDLLDASDVLAPGARRFVMQRIA